MERLGQSINAPATEHSSILVDKHFTPVAPMDFHPLGKQAMLGRNKKPQCL